uniref:Secreted protein n=1 Tax=Anguilla anguilla TaxID=7936 RepID=A0A0E9TSZ0_ANGAN
MSMSHIMCLLKGLTSAFPIQCTHMHAHTDIAHIQHNAYTQGYDLLIEACFHSDLHTTNNQCITYCTEKALVIS